jgi:hypothetical protein
MPKRKLNIENEKLKTMQITRALTRNENSENRNDIQKLPSNTFACVFRAGMLFLALLRSTSTYSTFRVKKRILSNSVKRSDALHHVKIVTFLGRTPACTCPNEIAKRRAERKTEE